MEDLTYRIDVEREEVVEWSEKAHREEMEAVAHHQLLDHALHSFVNPLPNSLSNQNRFRYSARNNVLEYVISGLSRALPT
ncbi:hypothetical protein P9112_006418 [Eukaryota sp. TZLM1-RC]